MSSGDLCTQTGVGANNDIGMLCCRETFSNNSLKYLVGLVGYGSAKSQIKPNKTMELYILG